MELFKDTRFDFLRRKWWFILPSFILTFAGLASLIVKGGPRYSIDFRTVNLADLRAGLAAPNVDSSPVGTSLRDFVRGSDGAPMPEEVVQKYDNAPAAEGVLVYRPAED